MLCECMLDSRKCIPNKEMGEDILTNSVHLRRGWLIKIIWQYKEVYEYIRNIILIEK